MENFSDNLPRSSQIPWLILPDNDPHCGFYDLSQDRSHRIEFPEAYSNRCCGSSRGWLVMAGKSPSLFMMNPLTRQRIELPPITTFPDVLNFSEEEIGNEYRIIDGGGKLACETTFSSEFMQSLYMNKVILMDTPSLHEEGHIYTAMAIYSLSGRLGFCRHGDQQWQQVSETLQTFINDVIYWKEKELFYAISSSGELIVCDLKGPKPVVEIKELKSKPGAERSYLVVSSGELLLVIRSCRAEKEEGKLMYRTTSFKVYKLDEEAEDWERMESIGDGMLFVGVNATECFSARDFPRCKPNHIYFTDNYDHYDPGLVGGHDLGAMNLETNEFIAFPCCSKSSCFIWPHPVWIVPFFH